MLLKFLLLLSLFWLLVHGIARYAVHKSQPILPLTATSSQYHLKHSSFAVRSLHLRLHTTAWNARHDAFATKLAQHRNHRKAYLLRTFYDFGTICSIFGMLLAFAYMLWNLIHAFQMTLPRHNHRTETLAKRSFDGLSPGNSDTVSSSNPFITLIIPGVTVPLSHIPAILLAVFWSQVVHEFGHAFAAAVENMPITSIGMSVTVIIPAAFVRFSSGLFESLVPRAQARITAAGPFHNLILWCILGLVGWSGVGDVITTAIGYKDIHRIGRVVLDVNEASPLYYHLKPGTLVTKLDDTALGSLDPMSDIWTMYLTTNKKELQPGWCVAEQALEGQESCCSRSVDESSSGLSCFAFFDNSDKRACIDAVPVLTQVTPRCNTTGSCLSGRICVQPAKNEQLLRVTFQRPDAEAEQTILWSGPRTEVWEEVEVGNFAPRISISPVWLPATFDMFWQYLKMATLSLFFLNLLPLPHLDGEKLLNSFLDMTFRSSASGEEIYDIEALEGEDERGRQVGRSRYQWKRRLAKYVPRATLCVVALSTILTLLNIG